MNHPLKSKINYLSLAILAVGIAGTAGLIPAAWQDHALNAVTLLAPVAIIIARTWFTDKSDA